MRHQHGHSLMQRVKQLFMPDYVIMHYLTRACDAAQNTLNVAMLPSPNERTSSSTHHCASSAFSAHGVLPRVTTGHESSMPSLMQACLHAFCRHAFTETHTT